MDDNRDVDPQELLIRKAAMSIVNHITETLCTPVEVRQRLNDELDTFVVEAIKDVHATIIAGALV